MSLLVECDRSTGAHGGEREGGVVGVTEMPIVEDRRVSQGDEAAAAHCGDDTRRMLPGGEERLRRTAAAPLPRSTGDERRCASRLRYAGSDVDMSPTTL